MTRFAPHKGGGAKVVAIPIWDGSKVRNVKQCQVSEIARLDLPDLVRRGQGRGPVYRRGQSDFGHAHLELAHAEGEHERQVRSWRSAWVIISCERDGDPLLYQAARGGVL